MPKKVTTLTTMLEEYQGKKADEIAEIVKRRGIKGRMGTTYGCPMALLLKGTHTGQYIIGRRYIVRRSGTTIEKSRTPENVSTFIRKFDIGKYPEIIAPPPRCMAKSKVTKTRNHSVDNRSKRKRVVENHISKLVNRFVK